MFFYIRLNAYCIHTNDVYQQYKGNICNRAFKCGSELPEYVALILRNGDSPSPDRWLRELQNNQSIDPCALASSKKLIVFSCHLKCGIKKLISQGAGFDVYLTFYISPTFYRFVPHLLILGGANLAYFLYFTYFLPLYSSFAYSRRYFYNLIPVTNILPSLSLKFENVAQTCAIRDL